MNQKNNNGYVLPSTESESMRLHIQGARLYGGVKFLKPFLEEKPKKILDVGCGTGFFSKFAADTLPNSEVIGVDSNDQRLNYARERNSNPNLKFTNGSLPRIPFEDDTFDLAFCRFVLAHAANPANSLCEMTRVVKPGGRLVAYEAVHDGIWFSPKKPAVSKILDKLILVMQQRGMEPSPGLYLATGMVQAGLKNIEAKAIPHSCRPSDPIFEDCRKNWIDTISGLNEILGDEFKKSDVKKAMEELREDRPDTFILEITVLAQGMKAAE